jgi:DNA-binding response OmpR family regulator
VLLDDEPAVGRLVNEELSHDGFEFRSAFWGQEEFAFMQREALEAIIRMARITGWNLLKKPQEELAHSALPTATSLGQRHVGIEGRREGQSVIW